MSDEIKSGDHVQITKTLKNTTSDGASKNVRDIKFWGNGDLFKLISKAWSEDEKWMKSTKAMEIPGKGCVVQVTTQQGDNIAEAVTFVEKVKIAEISKPGDDGEPDIIARLLVPAEWTEQASIQYWNTLNNK